MYMYYKALAQAYLLVVVYRIVHCLEDVVSGSGFVWSGV